MGNKDKAFCSKCKWFWADGWGGVNCAHSNNLEDSPIRPKCIHKETIYEKNLDNECGDFERIPTFKEFIKGMFGLSNGQ